MTTPRRTLLTFFTLFFGVWCSLSLTGTAQSPGDTFKVIYDRFDKAMMAKDVDFLTNVLARDYRGKSKEGEVSDKSESVAKLKQSFAMIESISSFTTKIDKIEEGRDQVVITVTQTMRAMLAGPDGLSHEMVITARSLDTWGHEGKEMKMKASDTLAETATLDGKPYGD